MTVKQLLPFKAAICKYVKTGCFSNNIGYIILIQQKITKS